MTTTIQERLAEDRRGTILRALDEAAGQQLAERTVKHVTDLLCQMVSSDEIRTDLHWLQTQGLIRLDKMPMPDGELWVAHLVRRGEDVARGVPHPGVRHQAPQR